jgi:hypothetical protein
MFMKKLSKFELWLSIIKINKKAQQNTISYKKELDF